MYLWRWVRDSHNRVDAMVIQRGGLEGYVPVEVGTG